MAFNRSWSEFRSGFGCVTDDYWMGNEALSQMTSSGKCRMKFIFQSPANRWYVMEYNVSIANESLGYAMTISSTFVGNSTNPLNSHNGKMFSTWDRDNDVCPTCNCAAIYGAGWWFSASAYNGYTCGSSNMNSGDPLVGWGMWTPRTVWNSQIWVACA